MSLELDLIDSGSPGILRARTWIYTVVAIVVVASAWVSGINRVTAMVPVLGAALVLPRLASPANRLHCALAIDVWVALVSWWLFGPAAGTDFILLIIAAVTALVYEGARRNWLIGLVLAAALAQIPLHFWAKSVSGLPLFHPPAQVVSDSEFVAGVLFRVGVLVLAAALLAVVGRSFRRLVRSRDEFVASVSHELRTPLTAVVGFSSVLESSWRDLSEEDLDLLIRDIFHESGEVSSIVEDLLVMARADMGAVTLTPTRLVVEEELDRVVASLRADDVNSIVLEVGPCRVWADATRFRQILRNMLANAIRYGGEHIRVSSTTDGGMVTIVVEDDGDGVSGDPERIFEPYVRAHENPTQPASVGLGLAVSRSLARGMEGDLVYERSGGLTRFRLTIPVPPVTELPPVATASDSSEPSAIAS